MSKSMTATLKYALSSHKKMEVAAKLIRGQDVNSAVTLLENAPKKSTSILLKVLNSAIANATNNAGANKENLYVSRVDVGKGLMLRRMKFGSRARVKPYKKYRSFIRVVLNYK